MYRLNLYRTLSGKKMFIVIPKMFFWMLKTAFSHAVLFPTQPPMHVLCEGNMDTFKKCCFFVTVCFFFVSIENCGKQVWKTNMEDKVLYR